MRLLRRPPKRQKNVWCLHLFWWFWNHLEHNTVCRCKPQKPNGFKQRLIIMSAAKIDLNVVVGSLIPNLCLHLIFIICSDMKSYVCQYFTHLRFSKLEKEYFKNIVFSVSGNYNGLASEKNNTSSIVQFRTKSNTKIQL